MNILHFVIGAILLVFGRRLFWLFIAVIGFMAGFQLTSQYFGIEPIWAQWAVGLISGIAGALLALFFQRLAVGLGGFAAGGYIALHLATVAGIAPMLWIYLVGGVIGAVLMIFLFDWALIFISSLAGASLIVQNIHWAPLYEILLYLGLILVGIAWQGAWMRVRAVKSKRRMSAFSR